MTDTPIRKRYLAIQGLVRATYREKPELREGAPGAVRALAEAEYMAADAFAALRDDSLDAPTRLRLYAAWGRFAHLCLQYRRALGLVPRRGEDEKDEVPPWLVG